MYPTLLQQQHSHGFTLVELLIVVTIVGLLSAIAYPSYRSYILKSHRADALAALSQNQAMLERCYAQNFSYSASCATLPTFPIVSPQGYYLVTLSNQSATSFTLTASATGTQTADTQCAKLTLDQANQQLATDVTGKQQTVCWHP